MKRIAIVEYGRGNIHSVAKALLHLDAEPVLVEDPSSLLTFDRAILPGVGAFSDAMAALRRSGMAGAVTDFAAAGRPVLGICLGMQVLLQTGTEGGPQLGLALVPGEVRRLAAPGMKIPHVGWNTVASASAQAKLLAGIPEDSYFYFVHSYAAFPDAPGDWAGSTEYGERFASVVGHGTIWGTQFHPEKSGPAGMALLRNFLLLEGGPE